MEKQMFGPEEILRQLPGQIHKWYELPEDTMVFHLKYSENFTYRLESKKEGIQYALRVNRPGYHSMEELTAELVWMKALRADTDIQMADVIPGKDGKLLQELSLSGTEDRYVCTLFSFVEGEGIRGIEKERLVKYQWDIGAITAKLHNHAVKWNPDNTLPRFTWDWEDLFGPSSRWGEWEKNQKLSEEQRKIFARAAAIGEDRLRRYGKGKDRYGLIHSDLNINNILVENDEVRVLDFDDCGYGWFLYDLSTAVLEYDDTLPEMVEAWLAGYESVRKLSKEDKDEIETFIVLRKIIRMGWIASHADNDTVKRVTDRYYEQTTRMAEKYVQKYGRKEDLE